MNPSNSDHAAGPETEKAPQAPAVARKVRGVMPMEEADLPAVGRIFNRAFRQRDAEASPDLIAYLGHVYFRHPDYRPETGSIVHRNAEGRVDAALLSLPIPFEAGGERVTGRLMGGFMADGKAGFGGAARIVHSIRTSKPDLCYADNASPVSADHWVISGAALLPVQSLAWRRIFRPFAANALRLGEKLPALGRLPVTRALAPLDAVSRRLTSSFEPPEPNGTASADIGIDDFHACFEAMTERFTVRPAWSREQFRWFMDTAAMNATLGRLVARTVTDAKGVTIGAYLFFSKPGGLAEVMHTLSLPGKEFDTVQHMFSDLYCSGHAAASGMAQPVLMNALMRQRRMTFAYRGYLCLLTRHDTLRDAAIRGDIVIGGLASEAWNRLMTDFRA